MKNSNNDIQGDHTTPSSDGDFDIPISNFNDQKHDDSHEKKQKPHDKKKNGKKKFDTWWIKASIIALFVSAIFAYISELTASAEQIVVILLLLIFLVLIGIIFDAIGVAVTSCDPTPIISMASRKIYGAKTALWLVKNSGTVASICNDIIGDIVGVVAGACSAAIVFKLVNLLNIAQEYNMWVSIAISAVVSTLIIGGKAFMKNVAINNSRDFVMFVARILAPFSKEERKIKKKNKDKTSKVNHSKDKDSKDK